jgi:Winged helix-turn helix
VVVRAKMILYAAEAQSTAEIARRLETAPRVVNRWRKRFFEERLAGLEDRECAGRPRRFPPEQVAELKALACELPATYGLPLSRSRSGGPSPAPTSIASSNESQATRHDSDSRRDRTTNGRAY